MVLSKHFVQCAEYSHLWWVVCKKVFSPISCMPFGRNNPHYVSQLVVFLFLSWNNWWFGLLITEMLYCLFPFQLTCTSYISHCILYSVVLVVLSDVTMYISSRWCSCNCLVGRGRFSRVYPWHQSNSESSLSLKLNQMMSDKCRYKLPHHDLTRLVPRDAKVVEHLQNILCPGDHLVFTYWT